jgi:hypothetical protein
MFGLSATRLLSYWQRFIMARKKSVKHLLKVGTLIRTGLTEIYEVTALLENKFQCKNVGLLGSDYEFTQEFYYNIDMIVFEEVGRNVA